MSLSFAKLSFLMWFAMVAYIFNWLTLFPTAYIFVSPKGGWGAECLSLITQSLLHI